MRNKLYAVVYALFAVLLTSCFGIATSDQSSSTTQDSTISVGGGGMAGSIAIGGQGGSGSNIGGDTAWTNIPLTSHVTTYEDCTKTFVYAPPAELSNVLEVTCYIPEKDVQVLDFEYYLYSGSTFDLHECGQNIQSIIWFKVSANSSYQIDGDPVIYTETKEAKDFEWIDNEVNGVYGSVARVMMDIPDMPLTPRDMFCFGHRLTIQAFKPTCNVACLSSTTGIKHQISLDSVFPYGFLPIGDLPGVTYFGEKMNFISGLTIQ